MLRCIEKTAAARRETVSRYLRAAGIADRGPGRPGKRPGECGQFVL